MSKKKNKSPRVKQAAPAKTQNRKNPLAATNLMKWMGLCLLVTVVAYLPAFTADFVNWDDPDYVNNNTLIRSFGNLGQLVTAPLQGNHHPLTMISLAVNYAISGANAWSYHLLNLLLHLANTGLAFWLAWRLSGNKFWVALVTGLLFGIHPMHVESVAWVSERKDVLYGFFYLLGLVAYLGHLEKPGVKSYLAVAGWFVLSLLSKPAAVVFPVTLLAVDYWMKRPLGFKLILEKAPLFALSLAMGLLTLNAQSVEGATEAKEFFPFSYTMFFGFYAFATYWFKLVLPINLCTYYSFPPINEPLPMLYYLSPLFAVAVGALLFKVRKQTRLFAFALAFFLINIILVLQFFTVGSAIIADRYTYIPFWGAFFLIGYGVHHLVEVKQKLARPMALRLVGGVALVLAILCFRQAATWKNGEALWDHTIKVKPSSRAYTNRALLYREAKDNTNALAMVNEAIKMNKADAAANNIRGNIFLDLKQYDQAILDLNESISINPKNANAYNSRGTVYSEMKQYDKALADFNQTLAMDSTHKVCYINRGLLFYELGRHREAIQDYLSYLRFEPDNADVWNSLGASYQFSNDYPKAIEAFSKAIVLNPKQGVFSLNRARLYKQLGDVAKARADARQAQQLGTQVPADLLQ